VAVALGERILRFLGILNLKNGLNRTEEETTLRNSGGNGVSQRRSHISIDPLRRMEQKLPSCLVNEANDLALSEGRNFWSDMDCILVIIPVQNRNPSGSNASFKICSKNGTVIVL
jgi:hypothetical protein